MSRMPLSPRILSATPSAALEPLVPLVPPVVVPPVAPGFDLLHPAAITAKRPRMASALNHFVLPIPPPSRWSRNAVLPHRRDPVQRGCNRARAAVPPGRSVRPLPPLAGALDITFAHNRPEEQRPARTIV